MGFKAIELQIAIPRSQDAGKMQDQGMRQGQQFQETLTQQQLREQVINRTKVNEFDNIHKRSITDDKEKEKDEREKRRNKKRQTTNPPKTESIKHPYLGTKIDYSG